MHYNTGRKKPNQSPSESIAQGRATCTGLSILLVNACRSVGIPARVVGVANWKQTEGNHTWVEIWDEDGWHFMGADEPDSRGLDHAWFEDRAAQAVAGDVDYAVWATSFNKTGAHFPMAWNREDTSVPAVDVTHRYLKKEAAVAKPATYGIRLWDKQGGRRLWASVLVIDEGARILDRFSTRAGKTDLNDMPSCPLTAGQRYQIHFMHDGQSRMADVTIEKKNSTPIDIIWSECRASWPPDIVPFAVTPNDEIDALLQQRYGLLAKAVAASRREEIDHHQLMGESHKLKWLEKTFGDKPADGRSLWISLHGGGGAPAKVNDRQWQNQIKLYEPKEGIYVAPRAPTDTWNLWHQGHVDALLNRLIENYVALRDVNPNKVFLLGYSAGGDGVYQLAPRMADRFAAAAMMAGHPNEAKPLGLRNLPFAIFVGGDDSAYDRNKVARQWGDQLAALQKADPAGYPHRVTIYPGLGHWMEGRETEALAWMARHTRNPWPAKIVWHQDDVTHTRFYWLEVEAADAKQGNTIRAEVEGQTIRIITDDVRKVTLRLRDALIDLDKPITVTANGKTVYEGRVARTRWAIEQSLRQRNDDKSAATALLTVDW